jgi:hypothetical protein
MYTVYIGTVCVFPKSHCYLLQFYAVMYTRAGKFLWYPQIDHTLHKYIHTHTCSEEVDRMKRAYEAMQRDMEAAASQGDAAVKFALSRMSC